MIIKYTTKKGKEKEIKIDPQYESITIVSGSRDFAQVHVRDSKGRRGQHIDSILGKNNCSQVAFLGTECKLRRKTYRRSFRD